MSLLGFFRRPDPGLVAAGVPRSSKWPPFLKAFLRGKTCVCCGSRGPLTGHHKLPFSLRPDLELVESNVAPICDGTDCHLVIGHMKDFKLYNPDFDADAAAFLAKRMAAKKAQGR
jgi:hypothetical protein